ncbi:zonular occludens toxin domain-containing protein [Hydrocarboniphaga sp.]|uniref:zonular occludens toxin domain-containing protein n=1 Tax=Hydrocarboniphaga sp. TaxID=2033016 RepID=UPI002AB870FC|nr:zonular occludens toxin domain-containing protein [Hydrocarboniphaga sp.]MDZ4080945.1 zonular occludens toxin domain-containing protein [Hydrocarboniphaga sp.]
MTTAVINVVTGINRSGKTLYMLPMVEKLRKETGRPVYYWGIPGIEEMGKLPDWHKIEEFEDTWPHSVITEPAAVHKLPSGSIIVVDEAHKAFGRSSNRETPPHIEPFAMSGHVGHTFFLCTQNAADLHHFIRSRIGQHWHLQRAFGMERATVFSWQEFGDPASTKSVAKAMKEEFTYPKEVYDWYRSSGNHQIKRQLPIKKLIQLPIFVVLMLACAYFVWTKIKGKDEPEEQPVAKQQVDPTATAPAGTPAVPHDARAWSVRFEERVPGIPYSAPIYDASLKPVTMPKIAGCMEVISPQLIRCTCNTQQGTRITTMSYQQCKFYLANGWFDPTLPDAKEGGQGTSTATTTAEPPKTDDVLSGLAG